jgi:uncharacterized protein Usg
MSEFRENLTGSRLLTAEVLYWMPDHPKLLQSFLWQTLDLAPRYPRLTRFLDHWRREVDAAIHSVTISQGDNLGPPKLLMADAMFRLN